LRLFLVWNTKRVFISNTINARTRTRTSPLSPIIKIPDFFIFSLKTALSYIPSRNPARHGLAIHEKHGHLYSLYKLKKVFPQSLIARTDPLPSTLTRNTFKILGLATRDPQPVQAAVGRVAADCTRIQEQHAQQQNAHS
jgi:hypothetical protein